MSFVTEIMNPFIVVRNKIRNQQGNWVDQKKRSETMQGKSDTLIGTTSDNIEILNTYGKKTIVDKMVFSSSVDVTLGMHFSDSGSAFNNNIAMMMRPHTSDVEGRKGLNWTSIKELGNPLFELIFDDDSTDSITNGGVISLKEPFEFPNGCRVNFYDIESDSETLIHYQIIYREIDE